MIGVTRNNSQRNAIGIEKRYMSILALEQYALNTVKVISFVKIRNLDTGELHTPELNFIDDYNINFTLNWDIQNAKVQIFTE